MYFRVGSNSWNSLVFRTVIMPRVQVVCGAEPQADAKQACSLWPGLLAQSFCFSKSLFFHQVDGLIVPRLPDPAKRCCC